MYSAGCYPADLELFQKRTLLARPYPYVCLYLFIYLLFIVFIFIYLLTWRSPEYDLCSARADTDSDPGLIAEYSRLSFDHRFFMIYKRMFALGKPV